MYSPPLGVHVLPIQRHSARPRGAKPQDAGPQVMRPRGGRARHGSGHNQYDFGPHGSGFQSIALANHVFPTW
jgi:hypothetical protein